MQIWCSLIQDTSVETNPGLNLVTQIILHNLLLCNSNISSLGIKYSPVCDYKDYLSTNHQNTTSVSSHTNQDMYYTSEVRFKIFLTLI